MRIAVLVKQVPDTWGERRLDPATGRADRSSGDQVIDEIAERAVEVALTRKDGDRTVEVLAVTMGPAGAGDGLRRVLAMGVDRAVLVVDDELTGSDTLRTAHVLAAVLRREEPDLVLAGNESTDGRGGVVPAMLAELLGWPLLSGLATVELTGDTVSGSRTTDDGALLVRATLPAVVSITEALPDPRFAGLRGIMAAKRKPVARLGLADLAGAAGRQRSQVLTATARPPRAGGVLVTDDGAAAGRLADFLADRHLI